MISTYTVKVATLAVIVPLAVFIANWVHRSRKGYSQTAAADFLLGVFIFDASVILATDEFRPFLQSAQLRGMIAYWHFDIGFVAGLLWLAILRFGEPVIENYYRNKAEHSLMSFPFFTFIACWLPVLIIIAFHVGFFAYRIEVGHV